LTTICSGWQPGLPVLSPCFRYRLATGVTGIIPLLQAPVGNRGYRYYPPASGSGWQPGLPVLSPCFRFRLATGVSVSSPCSTGVSVSSPCFRPRLATGVTYFYMVRLAIGPTFLYFSLRYVYVQSSQLVTSFAFTGFSIVYLT